MFPLFVPVHPVEKDKNEQVGKSFIDLGRMFGYIFTVPEENESPWQCCFNAIYF